MNTHARSRSVQDYLQSENVDFDILPHPHAFTARETAERAHVPGREMAKTVMVKLDGKLAMAVVAANEWVELENLRMATGASEVRLVAEEEFKDRFPECEVGAMSPFGNLYGMQVIASDTLAADEKIAFNAGSHRELVRMNWSDFERLVHPQVMRMTRH